MSRYVVYTDGSSKGKIGTCAYVVVSRQEVVHSKAFKYHHTTNNRMELEGLYQALSYIKNSIGKDVPVEVYTDSIYTRDGITVWIKRWRGNGWKRLDEVYGSMMNIKLSWCKGHAGNKWNELADRLCTEAYSKSVKEPEREKEQVIEESITAKKFLLDNYFSNAVSREDKELWYQCNDWPKEIVTIMEKYKNQ